MRPGRGLPANSPPPPTLPVRAPAAPLGTLRMERKDRQEAILQEVQETAKIIRALALTVKLREGKPDG